MTDSTRHLQGNDEPPSFLEQVLQYQDGQLTEQELEAFASQIRIDPDLRRKFIDLEVQSAAIHEVLRWDIYNDPGVSPDNLGPVTTLSLLTGWTKRYGVAISIIAASLLIVLAFLIQSPLDRGKQVELPAPLPPIGDPVLLSNVFLTEEHHALFFGEVSLTTGSSLQTRQGYRLQRGIVKLTFPNAASAIIEAPALFRVIDDNCLMLVAGSCSVHAPHGAEGFRVETPSTKVIDRGTRFSVKVNDGNETEVHVIEGEAELYPSLAQVPERKSQEQWSDSAATLKKIPLHKQQAIRVDGYREHLIDFDSRTYVDQLPDRIVSYEATRTSEGYAQDLVSVTAQRGGQVHTYSVEELIPIEVTWFRGDTKPDSVGHLIGDYTRPVRPQELLEDRKLYTGMINPGGQAEPLDKDPIMETNLQEGVTGTPGMGIRFRTPVVNGPGPDVVLFEIQSFLHPLDGDPFHVYPVHSRPGLKPLTVRRFDLTMNSKESLEVVHFWRHRFSKPIESLMELETEETFPRMGTYELRFRVLAVGIDLSEMGFAEGEQVQELFIQHAIEESLFQYVVTDPTSKVDPVFIAGFPEDKQTVQKGDGKTERGWLVPATTRGIHVVRNPLSATLAHFAIWLLRNWG
ncbi:MAG TPA: FecR domain-containing protein [Planctomicrobium sp.]|nr:FecR domain-containing protein [Planctomicrobium sp.]